VRLKFTAGALAEVARRAYAQKTGARGLRAILERVMLELMYEIPSSKNVKECIITEEAIKNTAEPILVYDQDMGVKSA
jgi:ATP-dependent Clp protease ATP-binding subunit ClpX